MTKKIKKHGLSLGFQTADAQWRFHPLSREHFSLKIVVRDQTIWNCILEL